VATLTGDLRTRSRIDRRSFIASVAGLLGAPLVGETQQHARKVYRVSFLALVPGEDTSLMKALLERLHELG